MLFFSFISGSGGKERLADRGVYVWLTCYGWCCVGLILTPTQAPLCFLLQAVPWTRTGKMPFLCFPFSVSFFNLCIFSFLHASIFFKTRLLSLWYWCTLTIDIDCQVDWVMFYIPRCGEVAACLIPVPFGYHDIWCCWLCAWVLVCVCSLYNKWFAQLKVISAKKHFSTNNSCKNHDFIHAPWEY